MDNERFEGETTTVRTHDRGEISGKPAGAADGTEPQSEAPVRQQELAREENERAEERRER